MYRECPLCHTTYVVAEDSSYGASCPHCGPFAMPFGPSADPYGDVEGELSFETSDEILGDY